MMNNIAKVSVMVMTYNQEDVIARTINSLLNQKDYIYEICVSDDCSKDKTWEIISDYDNKYPGLFKLNRNSPNIGIFENIEKLWTMPTGDLMYLLAGDDECGEGWFKRVIDYINNHHIDYKNKRFSIYGDYKAVYPNGDSFVFSNSLIQSSHNALGLALRKLVCNRSVCYSRKVLEKFVFVSEGRSYSVESGQDCQVQIFSDENFYLPYVGNIYYTNIGVSTGKNRNGLKIDPSTPMQVVQRVLDKTKYKLPTNDRLLMKFYHERALLENDVIRNPHYKSSIKYFLRKLMVWWYLLLSADLGLGFKGFKIKRYLFAVMRRLPHKRALDWAV